MKDRVGVTCAQWGGEHAEPSRFRVALIVPESWNPPHAGDRYVRDCWHRSELAAKRCARVQVRTQLQHFVRLKTEWCEALTRTGNRGKLATEG